MICCSGRRRGSGSGSHPRWATGVIITLLALAGCTPAVSVQIRTGSEARYLQLWAKDWKAINGHLQQLVPSGGDPGACNLGGSQAACLAISQQLLADFRALESDLSGGWVPTSLLPANRAILAAVAKEIEGLTLRTRALQEGDDVLWQQANSVFRQLPELFASAYNKFPDGLIPQPPPVV